MSVTPTNIIPAKYAENSQTTQYTSTNAKTMIDAFDITNNSSAIATISVHLVASGGSATTENRIVPARSIGIGETYPCPEVVGHTLESGGFISTVASAASALTIMASGRTVT